MRPETVPIWQWGDSPGPLRELVERGGILGIPTGSSYALGVDPRNRRAVAAVFAVKDRPAGKPLPVVLGELEQLTVLGGDPAAPQLRLLESAWPGPLTVIVPVRPGLPAAAGSTLGVRIPGHDRLRRLLLDLGLPLTATSANRSGRRPILEPAPLAELLAGRDAMIVDDGRLVGGEPSTLIRFDRGHPTVLRQGRYPLSQLRELLGEADWRQAFSAATAEKPVDESGRS